MTSTITYAGATTPILPIAVHGYEASFESGTVVHPIAGRADADVTLAPGGLRFGTLSLVFSDDVAVDAARVAHALPVAFTLQSTRTVVAMYYVVVGQPRVRLDETRRGWVLDVPFQEIAP